MTYSYQPGPLTYGPPANNGYYENTAYQKPSALPIAIGGAVVGAGTGAFLGNRKNPYITSTGEVVDTFAKTAYEKYINKAKDAGKEAYEGGLNILKKIDSVKSTEELKGLFDANKEAAKDVCTELKQTPEEFLNKVTQDNLSANKKVIKEKINAGNNTRYQDMKNQIQICWDKDKKKFVKNDAVKDDVYKAIKKSTNGVKGKIIGKYAAIGAGIAGIIGFIAGKLFLK